MLAAPGARGSKAVLFVLDQFDRFAGRAKQAVLYTLLDSLQTSNMQVTRSPAPPSHPTSDGGLGRMSKPSTQCCLEHQR